MSPMKISCPVIMVFSVCIFVSAGESGGFLPGERVLMEAHNCYPYHGLWHNRIDRALETGVPLGIEIDLCWHAEGNDGAGRLVVAHEGPFDGKEPTLREYFFERVRPLVEQALASEDKRHWPLITLNINDIRGHDRAMHPAVWTLTGEYENWLCTAVKGSAQDPVTPIEIKPVLVLTSGGSPEVEQFYDVVPVGGRLRIFGRGSDDKPADNFRRWVNYSWSAVEPEGQNQAGEWTSDDAERLATLVKQAHEQGYWIRFYSLNGHNQVTGLRFGWGTGYNFGSLEVAQQRWEAARAAGVDFIATDQCEEAAACLKKAAGNNAE